MDDVEISRGLEETHEGKSLSFGENLRVRLNSINIRRSGLWEEMQRLGSWMELEAAQKAEERNQSTVDIRLGREGTIESLRIGPRKHEHDLSGQQELWSFMSSLGIGRIILDTRLERNQITDVLTLLHTFRHKLAQRNTEVRSAGVVGNLLGEPGVHIACTDTWIAGDTLRIAYSYCTLRFSRSVRWFERAHKDFRDHRALFHTAPRYAILIGLIVAGPIIFYALWQSDWMLLSLTVVSTAILLAVIYYFFMIVGSVEYDNEEQAYRLQKTYGELKLYADRIQRDIQRARVVQERLLPDPENMALADRIDWAMSFVPAEEVGGDYFDVHALDDDRVIILFSDVSGHGMGAAFITAIIETTFQAGIDRQESLTAIVKQINTALCRLTPADSFAAAFLAVYDTASNCLSYVNGGHQPEPWLIPADRNKAISPLSGSRNILLGVKDEFEVHGAEQMLGPGDRIIFVSDGIVENRNVDGEFYGTETFEEFLETHRDSDTTKMVGSIVEDAAVFSRDAEQSDDRTILAFQIKDL